MSQPAIKILEVPWGVFVSGFCYLHAYVIIIKREMKTNSLNRKANVSSVDMVTIRRPSSGWISINLRDLWAYRELLYFLTWREIKVRYKQTALGFAWAIIQPFFMMVVFTLFFGRLAKIPSEGIPYPLFNYAALLPWILFHDGVSKSSMSLVAGRSLLTKVYFPYDFFVSTGKMYAKTPFVTKFTIACYF